MNFSFCCPSVFLQKDKVKQIKWIKNHHQAVERKVYISNTTVYTETFKVKFISIKLCNQDEHDDVLLLPCIKSM